MRNSNARDSLIVIIFARFMSKVTCPGPSIILRPASPNDVPLGLAHALLEPGVLKPKEEAGEQNAAVLNHCSVVGLPMEIGWPVTLAVTERQFIDPITGEPVALIESGEAAISGDVKRILGHNSRGAANGGSIV